MKSCKNLFFIIAMLTLSLNSYSQSIPKVFEIGENPKLFESLSRRYDNDLLDVCNKNIDSTIAVWNTIMLKTQNYADSVKFDIKGLRCWMKLYFNAQGKVDYIGYSLMPESRFYRAGMLEGFFQEFMKWFVLPVNTNKKFAHYAAAIYPVYYELKKE